jgi:hypothetical protein
MQAVSILGLADAGGDEKQVCMSHGVGILTSLAKLPKECSELTLYHTMTLYHIMIFTKY